MAFNREGLSGNGKGLWTYRSVDDALATMDTSGYFGSTKNNAYHELEIGDVIIASQVAGSIKAPTGVTAIGLLVVIEKTSAGVIDTSNINSAGFTLTDGD